jgi:hypothetical protein
MHHDPRHLRPLEGSGPWLHPTKIRIGQRRTCNRLLAACAVFIVILMALHVAPKAVGQFQYDVREYQR